MVLVAMAQLKVMKEVQDGPCNRLVCFGFESYLGDLCVVFFSKTLNSHSAFSKTRLLLELRQVLSCESPALFLHFPLKEGPLFSAPADTDTYFKS